jgi:type IV pilus assembly protein PilY1
MNRKPTLQPHPLAKALRLSRSWWAAPAAFLATLLALPVTAGVTIPDDPLTTGTRVAPNILFILDDSGSMEDTFMPDSVPSTSTIDVSMTAYPRNSLSYNPAVSYQTWTLANGNRRTGGTSYTSAYDHLSLASGSINLCDDTQYFHVPKDPNSTAPGYFGDGRNYYLYKIPAGCTEVIRSEYGAVVTTAWAPVTVTPATGSVNNSSSTHSLAAVVAGRELEVTIKSTNTRTADWSLRDPGNNTICSGSVDDLEVDTCTISPTVSGVYTVRMSRGTTGSATYSLAARSRSSNRCPTGGTGSNDWINCTPATPTGRTVADEKTNYAIWYSYHRTRMKAAKAGASDAFKPLGNRVRVGYRSIWDRSNFDIPVGDGNDGRFVDNPDDPGTVANEATTSRSTWYSRLHAADGSGRTPLKPALTAAGQYFGNTTATGPYGPQATASQYSCRQNFTILTTDGYWNQGTTSVGNADNSNGTTYTDPEGDTYGYTAAAPYRDSYSNTLADVAMHYWKTDLRTLTNNVPTSAGDPAFWQHMVTFGISIGLSGNKGWSSVGDVPANATWADPNDTEDADRIDDLLHAAVNGHGTFVSASSPSEFTAGLSQALAAIQQRTSSYSNVATNSVSLDAGSQVFNASYVSGIWTGKVTARAVSKTGVSDTTREFTIPAWGSRNVFTSNGLAGASFPTSTQEAALLRTGGPVDYPVTGAQNANYLKGDGSLEERNSGLLRNRPTTVLGDIVGSSPAYVKDTDTLYVGANDGMLHAFNATSGTELFAYVPGIINFNHLSTLSRGDYSHKFFVDGPIVVSNRNQTPSENILVGALGKGGKGVYSLNVGNPASATASSAFNWERSDTVGGHMGLVLGKPILGRVPAGQTAVILGNGVNSTSEKAVLIVLNLDTGAVIQQIDTGVGSAAAPNGLSAPVGVYDQDGKTIRYVYAGDMRGNVWKFDLNGAGSATRLFTAVGPSSNVQPISGGLAVAIHPVTKKRWVFFGTGRFLTTSDAEMAGATTQSMYGFEDTGTTLTRSDLEARGAPVVSGNVRTFQAKATLPTGRKGWYIDLTTSGGERIVQDAQVVNTFLITASMVPTGDACEADGTGYINALDAFTGTSAGGSYFDQNRNGDTSDDKVGGVPIGSINAGVGMPTLPNLLRGMLIVGGTAGDDLGDPSTLGVRWDRVSWREIRQD